METRVLLTNHPSSRTKHGRLTRLVSSISVLALSAGMGLAAIATSAQALEPPAVTDSWLDYYFNNKAIGGDLPGDRPNLAGGFGFHRTNLANGGMSFTGETAHPSDAAVTYRMGGNLPGGYLDNVEAKGQTVDTSAALGSGAAQAATKIAFVWTGHNADNLTAALPFKLNFDDDTSQTVSYRAADWCSDGNTDNSFAVPKAPRYGDNVNCTIFITNVATLPSGKKLDSVEFPDEDRVHIFAIASDADTSNASASFNAEVTVPASVSVGQTIAPSVQWIGEVPARTSANLLVDGVISDDIPTQARVVPADWAGKKIAFSVVGHHPGVAPVSFVSDEVTVTPAELTATVEPSLAGLPRVGDTLVINTGQYATATEDPATVGITVEWLADGAVIAGAFGKTFVPSSAQVGKTIAVRVTVSKVGHTTLEFTRTTASPVLAADENPFPTDPNQPGEPGLPDPLVAIKSAATVTGTTQVGSVLTVRPGTFEPANARVTYQWLRGTQPIAAATNSSYRLTPADANTVVSVRVIATAVNRQTIEQFLSAGLTEVGTITSKKPVIRAKKKAVKKKKVRVGQTLKASVKKVSAPGAKVKQTYRWFAGNKKIKGKKAGKAKFKVTKKFAKKRLSVQVTLNAPGYAKKTVKSVKTGKVVR